MPDAQGRLIQGDLGYVAPGAGLINVTPGETTTSPGIPVTSYTPAMATPSLATAATYDPNAFAVTSDMTAQGQLKNILDADSPLMQQAATRARQDASARGLLNSSIAIGAGQSAMIEKATPLATQDATTYFSAGAKTTEAQNKAREFNAQMQNQVAQTNAQYGTQTQLANQAAENFALGQSAEGVIKTKLAQLQADTTLTGVDRQVASAQLISQQDNLTKNQLAQIQANTAISTTDKQTASAQLISASDNLTKNQLALIQQDTTMSVTDKQTASAQLISLNDNITKAQLALIQQDTTLSQEDKRNASMQLISRGDNDTKALITSLQTAADISRTQLTVDTQLAVAHLDTATKQSITTIEYQNKQILQASASASNAYVQAITNITNIALSNTMSADAKDSATLSQLNMLSQQLNVVSNAAATASSAVSELDLAQYFGGTRASIPSLPYVGNPNSSPLMRGATGPSGPAGPTGPGMSDQEIYDAYNRMRTQGQ